MGSSSKIPLAFCCKENPCGVVVGKLTTCCSEKNVEVPVCLVPETLCNIAKTKTLIYTGTIEGYVEEESCFELSCQPIDYVCGEDDFPADPESGNCCPTGTGVTYVPWAIATQDLSESTADTCQGCCDDIGDPDPCGPFGATMSMNYFYKAYSVQGWKHFDDGKSCPLSYAFLGGRFMKNCDFDAHPYLQNTSCCSDYACGFTCDGGFDTQSSSPKEVVAGADCECVYNPSQYSGLHVGPTNNWYYDYTASCNIPRTSCYWNPNTGVGGGTYYGPGQLVVNRATAEEQEKTFACPSGTGTKTVKYTRGRSIPSVAVQGFWRGEASWTALSTRFKVQFFADDPGNPAESEAYFSQIVQTSGQHNGLTRAWDPVGDGGDPALYLIFEKCGGGPGGIVGGVGAPAGNADYWDPPITGASLGTHVTGPAATPYPTTNWETAISQQLFGEPDECGTFMEKGGRTFAITVSV